MRKSCNRKVRPLVNPFAVSAPLCQAARNDLQMRELMAIDMFATGQATTHEWADLKAFIDLTRTASSMGIGPEAMTACDAAMQALLSAARQCDDTGVMAMDADGINAMREVLAYADAQRQAIPAREYQRVVQQTIDTEYA